MIGGVVDVRFRVADDHHARSDEAAGIGGRVMQDRQQAAEIEALTEHMFLRRCLLNQDRRFWIPERTADELADAAEIDPECCLTIFLASENVADDRQVVALDVSEK